MRVVCSYCTADMGTKGSRESDAVVSHGICAACYAYFKRQWDGLTLGEYLDDVDGPVLVVDQDGRTVAANQAMADMLGKSERDMFGLLGGEVMECQYARLPGGCGKTVRCKACTIRNAVNHTRETGESRIKIPANVDRSSGRIDLVISTEKIGEMVRVIIEEGPGADPLRTSP